MAHSSLAGDPQREAEEIRSKKGIPLIKPVVDDLLDISRKAGYRLTRARRDFGTS